MPNDTYMTTKDITKYKCALGQETEQRLNEQVAMEAKSSASYLAMASWSDMKGYKGAASFLYNQAEEERAHMLKLFHYINDAGGHALQPTITEVQHSLSSLKEVFELALMYEVEVSQAIHRLADHCLASKDFATFNFLQWFLEEQIEEEATARRHLEFFDVIGEAGVGLHLIDKEIGAYKAREAEEA